MENSPERPGESLTFPNVVKMLLKGIGALAVVWGGWVAAVAFVESRVKSSLEDPSVLRKIAMQVRPTCVFNDRESILYDFGAMASISEIKLEFDKPEMKEARLPTKIIVRATRHLPVAPILTVTDRFTATIRSERGRKFDWVFSVSDYVFTGDDAAKVSADTKANGCIFRLELLY